MSVAARELIESFNRLPEADKKVVVIELLCSTINIDEPPLSDEELVLSAEEHFLELDRREAEDAQSQPQ